MHLDRVSHREYALALGRMLDSRKGRQDAQKWAENQQAVWQEEERKGVRPLGKEVKEAFCRREHLTGSKRERGGV